MAALPPRIHYLFFFPFDFTAFFLAAIGITAPTSPSWVYNAPMPFATSLCLLGHCRLSLLFEKKPAR